MPTADWTQIPDDWKPLPSTVTKKQAAKMEAAGVIELRTGEDGKALEWRKHA